MAYPVDDLVHIDVVLFGATRIGQARRVQKEILSLSGIDRVDKDVLIAHVRLRLRRVAQVILAVRELLGDRRPVFRRYGHFDVLQRTTAKIVRKIVDERRFATASFTDDQHLGDVRCIQRDVPGIVSMGVVVDG